MRFPTPLITSFFATTSSSIVSGFGSSTRSIFRPSSTAFVSTSHNVNPNAREFSSTAINMANVMKLTDPADNLLDNVDVFIFDCDGVIWRVSYI